MIEYLQRAVRTKPDHVALIDKDKQMTFAEINQKALSIAEGILRCCGEITNQPIAIFMNKSVDCIVAFFGVIYSGNFYIPLDIKSPSERLRKIIHILEPALIISMDSQVKLTSKGKNLCYNDIIQNNKIDYSMIEKQYKQVLDIDPLYVLFTSGSTGFPKGVTISHRSVIDYIEWLTETFHFDCTVIFGNQAPFYFDNSILDIYSTICNGATMVILPENLFVFPNRLFEFMNEKKVNTIFWVPSALSSIANSGILEWKHLEYLHTILFCGEVMPNKQLNMWRNVYKDAVYANLYGPTEITDVCSYYIVDRDFKDDEPLPIGKACENTELLVLNEKNELAGQGEIGELCVRGICLSKGYYSDKEKTNELFIQNPLNNRYFDLIYRTGDLVKYNSRGELIYIGRKDFQIKYQGYRIELGEIETVVYAVDKVKQNCVLFDQSKNKIILFYAADQDLTEKILYLKLKNRLPNYMLPGEIKRLDALPLNLNGKIDRVKLKEWYIE